MKFHEKIIVSVVACGALFYAGSTNAMDRKNPFKNLPEEQDFQPHTAGKSVKEQRLFFHIKKRNFDKVCECFKKLSTIHYDSDITYDDIFWVLLTAVAQSKSTIISKILHDSNTGIDYMKLLRSQGDQWFIAYCEDDFNAVLAILQNATTKNSQDFFAALVKNYPNPKEILWDIMCYRLVQILDTFFSVCQYNDISLTDCFKSFPMTKFMQGRQNKLDAEVFHTLLTNEFFINQLSATDYILLHLWCIELGISSDGADLLEKALGRRTKESVPVQEYFVIAVLHNLEKALAAMIDNDTIMNQLNENMCLGIMERVGDALAGKGGRILLNNEKFITKLPPFLGESSADYVECAVTRKYYRSSPESDEIGYVLTSRECPLF